MITLCNNELTPQKLCIMKHDQLIVENKQEDGIIFIFQSQRSKPLNVGEKFKFDCKIGIHTLLCEQIDVMAQVIVVTKYLDKERYEINENQYQVTKSEKCFDSDDITDENDEIMSANLCVWPEKKKKPLQFSLIADTSSTYYSKKENQSTTSDVSEQLFPERRKHRKGSDPVVQKKEQNSVQKPKTNKINKQTSLQLSIAQFAETIHPNQSCSITLEQIQKLQKNWNTSQCIHEYLINQFCYE